jgi:hypothetical protein
MRKAIALLLTLFFIMAITLSLGIGMGWLNSITQETQKEQFMIQSRLLLDDLLTLLKTSKDINSIVSDANGSEAFSLFLEQSSFIPLAYEDFEVTIEVSSARNKINPNTFIDANVTMNMPRVEALRTYLNTKRVDTIFADMLLDVISPVQEYGSYNSDIFTSQPHLFNEYLASSSHLNKVTDFFTQRYRYNTLASIPFEELFIYSKQRNTKIDLNVATAETWMFLLGCEQQRAEDIIALSGVCEDFACLELSDDEERLVKRFETSFYEPIIEVTLHLRKDFLQATIAFEYDLKQKKGSRFVYQI